MELVTPLFAEIAQDEYFENNLSNVIPEFGQKIDVTLRQIDDLNDFWCEIASPGLYSTGGSQKIMFFIAIYYLTVY